MELVVLRFSQEVSISNPKDSSNNFLVLGVKGSKKEIRIPVTENAMKEIVQIVFGDYEGTIENAEEQTEDTKDELVDIEEQQSQADIFEEEGPSIPNNRLAPVDEDGIESL